MSIDLDAYRAWRVEHPTRPLPRDMEEVLVAEIERLREEAHDLRLMVEEAARAENANAEDAKRERAAVVAFLREQDASIDFRPRVWPMAEMIERGEHRREEE